MALVSGSDTCNDLTLTGCRTFLVVEITPPMITSIGYKSYIVFAVINFVTVPVVWFCYPETSRLPLEVSSRRRLHKRAHQRD